jgi:hypothetical protein
MNAEWRTQVDVDECGNRAPPPTPGENDFPPGCGVFRERILNTLRGLRSTSARRRLIRLHGPLSDVVTTPDGVPLGHYEARTTQRATTANTRRTCEGHRRMDRAMGSFGTTPFQRWNAAPPPSIPSRPGQTKITGLVLEVSVLRGGTSGSG